MRTLATIAIAASLALSAASPQDLRDYAWAFPLTLPSTDPGNAWRIDLTTEVYAHVHDAALRDIAVFNADGRPVPSARVGADAPPGSSERGEPATLLALPVVKSPNAIGDLRLVVERDANGRLRRLEAGDSSAPAGAAATRDWLIDASAIHGALERLVLAWDTPADGVVAHFELAAGNDLDHWRPVGSGRVFALRHGDARLDRRDLPLGGVHAKYLRLHRSDDGAALTGLRAELRYTVANAVVPALVWVDAKALPAPAQANDDSVHQDYVLPAALPVRRVRIELQTDNALADVVLYGNSGEQRETLAHATAFRLRDGSDSLRNGDLDVTPRARLDSLRIESRTPLNTAPRVQVAFHPDRFVFLAEGSLPYTLATGSARAMRPDYPVEAALASLRARLGADWRPPPAHIGAGHPSGGDAALQPAPAPPAWRRWLLWAVLVAGVVLVGAFALSLLRSPRAE